MATFDGAGTIGLRSTLKRRLRRVTFEKAFGVAPIAFSGDLGTASAIIGPNGDFAAAGATDGPAADILFSR